MRHDDEVWKGEALVRAYLDGVRGGIPLAAEQIEAMLRVVAAPGAAVTRFLDLGCGSGVLAAALLERHPAAAATLLDFSEPMIEAARSRLGEREPAPRFVVADFGEPGWVDAVAAAAPFDAVVSGYAIHHQPDDRKRTLYGEIFDLLTPGGAFVNVEHVASPTARVARLADDLFVDSLAAFHERSGSGLTREQVAAAFVHRPDKTANILAPVEEQCGCLRDLGFADVDCYFKVFELAVFGGRRPEVGPGDQPAAE